MGRGRHKTSNGSGDCKRLKCIVVDVSSDSDSDDESASSRGVRGCPPMFTPANSIEEPVSPYSTAHRSVGFSDDRQSFQYSLDRVLEVFPDISRSFVQNLHESRSNGATEAATATDIHADIIQHIADMESYPTTRDEAAKDKENKATLKAKFDQQIKGLKESKQYQLIAEEMLKMAFPDISVAHIKSTLAVSTRLSEAYLSLSEATDSNTLTTQRLSKRRREPSLGDFLQYDVPHSMIFHAQNEIRLGRNEKAKRRAERQKEIEELQQEREAHANGQVGECACCFSDDVPVYKMTHCGGEIPHVFCFECTQKQVETELNFGRCRPRCMDTSGCRAPFLEHQLRLCLPERTLARLIRLQQLDDLKAAGIEGVEDCPFCDYIAVCHSALVDREFRCLNEECMKVSCRLCFQETHIPLTCEQSATHRASERNLGARHAVEEAMSDALVRSCNKCKQRFIKTEGCNKMSCPACGNIQCYVCRQDVTSYEHYTGRDGTKCPLHDLESVETRHAQEIEVAATKAKAGILSEQPDVQPEALNIELSQDAKRDDAARVVNANQQFALLLHHQRRQRERARAMLQAGGAPGFHRAALPHLRYTQNQLHQLDQIRARQATAFPPGPGLVNMMQIPLRVGLPPQFRAQVETMLQANREYFVANQIPVPLAQAPIPNVNFVPQYALNQYMRVQQFGGNQYGNRPPIPGQFPEHHNATLYRPLQGQVPAQVHQNRQNVPQNVSQAQQQPQLEDQNLEAQGEAP